MVTEFNNFIQHRLAPYLPSPLSIAQPSEQCKSEGAEMLKSIWNDEAGVVISAELVLIGTILVIGMIVGLVELQCAVVGELSDLGDAIGNLDQSYVTSGLASYKKYGGVKARTFGAQYSDSADTCDCNAIIVCDPSLSVGEKPSVAH